MTKCLRKISLKQFWLSLKKFTKGDGIYEQLKGVGTRQNGKDFEGLSRDFEGNLLLGRRSASSGNARIVLNDSERCFGLRPCSSISG